MDSKCVYQMLFVAVCWALPVAAADAAAVGADADFGQLI